MLLNYFVSQKRPIFRPLAKALADLGAILVGAGSMLFHLKNMLAVQALC